MPEVKVDIRADSTAFEAELKKARRAAGDFEKGTNKSRKAAKDLDSSLKRGERSLNKYKQATQKLGDASALLTGPLGGVASRIAIIGRVSSVSGAALLALGVAISGTVAAMAAAVREAGKFETSGLRLEAVLRATGHASGLTAKEIRGLSSEIALGTLASVEGVERAAAKLLTFRSISGETFETTLRLSQDLAELGFGTVESAATSLGKALENPAKGLSNLTRVGVTFSPQQEKMIKNLQEQNELFKAQEILLEGVARQAQGTGAAVTVGLAGAWDTLTQRVSEFLQAVGERSGLLQAVTGYLNDMANALNRISEIIDPSEEQRINDLLEERAELEEKIASGREHLLEMKDVPGGFFPGITNIRERIDEINNEIAALEEKIKAEEDAKKAARASAEAERQRIKLNALIAEQDRIRAESLERLQKIRESESKRLRDEVNILSQLLPMYQRQDISLRDIEKTRQSLSILTKTQLDASTEEGRALIALIMHYERLNDAIDEATLAREQQVRAQEDIANMQDEIAATEMVTTAIENARFLTDEYGQLAPSIRQAKIEAERFRYEQELIRQIMRESPAGTITEEQLEGVRQMGEEWEIYRTKVEEAELAQERARKQQEEWQESVKEFQEGMSDALTDLIFASGSLEDSLKSMILQMSKAIVQAKILEGIQFMMGEGAPGMGEARTNPESFTGALLSGMMTGFKFHQGGEVGRGGQRVSVPARNFISAPRFHDGLRSDEFPAILQKGEEVRSRDQVRRDRMESSRNVNVTVVTPDADSFRASKRQISRQLRTQAAF